MIAIRNQMCWTPPRRPPAQVATWPLNDQLAGDFHRWYPDLSRTLDPVTLAA